MSDDPKIVRLPTGYRPASAIDGDEIEQLNWSITLLKDEIEQLSSTQSGIVRVLKVLANKLDQLLERSK